MTTFRTLDPAVRDRILDRRTEALATRGLATDAAAPLGDHLVFRLGTQLYGLAPELVETILFYACHPVPLLRGPGAAVMLGVSAQGGRLWSVLELSRLLGLPDPPDANRGGKMLLLRGAGRPVAVRVDHVLGLVPLVRAGDCVLMKPGGRAISAIHPAGDDRLVLPLDRQRLHDALAALDHAAPDAAPSIPPDPGA